MGKITLLNTPIGNLGDVSTRMLDAYKNGQVFFAEDTRNFKSLLGHLSISLDDKKVYSFHDHSSSESLRFILELAQSEDIFLVSDAGSPIISDPAYPVVREAYNQGIEVDTISGVSSVISALELAGLPANPFTFLGFLPREQSKQVKVLEQFCGHSGSYLFFESPHRIVKTVEFLLEYFEECEVAVIREISKQYQQVVHFRSGEVFDASKLTVKGEFVVVLYLQQQKNDSDISDELSEYLEGKQSKKELSKLLAKLTNSKAKSIYSLLK